MHRAHHRVLLVAALAVAFAAAPLSPTRATAHLSGHDGSVNANGLTASEQRRLLRQDPTAHQDADGRIYFVDPPAPSSGGEPAAPGVAPYPLPNTFLLHSKPGSNLTLFIDVDGTTVSGTAWNNAPYNVPAGGYPAWDPAGDGASFSDAEKEEVQKIWQRVAEDYAPFDIDVTTQDPGLAGIERANSGDAVYGTRALVTPSLTAETAICGTPPACGGVAYINVFGEVGSFHQPAWVFPHELGPDDTKDIAEAISHEVGHNFSLQHDGVSGGPGYYAGHNMWAPIMGVGYQRPVVQWSKGEYTNANNTGQDDVALIAARAPFRTDEAGGTVATAAAGLPSGAVISSATDSDTFALGTCAGTVTVSASGAPPSPNLDIQLELLDAGGATISTANPTSAFVNRDSATGLDASITTGVASGAYFVRVDGVGNGTGVTGYTDYASIGAYTLSASGCNGQAPPAAPTNLAVTPDPTGTSATVTWAGPLSDGGSPVTGYLASRSGAAPDPLGATTFTKTWNGLTPGASYLFSVQATNAIGTGVAASQSVTMPAVPGQPASIVVSPAANGLSAQVAWTAPASNGGSVVTGYHLTRTGAAPVDLGLQGTYTWNSLTPGTTYTFGVAAINAVGTGPAATQSATTPSVPGAPTGLSAVSAPDGRSVTQTWSAPASDGGSALIDYRVSLDGGQPVDPGSNGTYVWTGLTPGTTHQLTVVARNAVGNGAAATTSTTTSNVPGAPAAPSAKKGKRGGKKTASISWRAPAADGGSQITGYTVLVFKANGALVKTVTGLGAARTTYTFKGRKAKYRFAIVALNAVGAGPASAQSRPTKVQ